MKLSEENRLLFEKLKMRLSVLETIRDKAPHLVPPDVAAGIEDIRRELDLFSGLFEKEKAHACSNRQG